MELSASGAERHALANPEAYTGVPRYQASWLGGGTSRAKGPNTVRAFQNRILLAIFLMVLGVFILCWMHNKPAFSDSLLMAVAGRKTLTSGGPKFGLAAKPPRL
jgi:hypothetical protein